MRGSVQEIACVLTEPIPVRVAENGNCLSTQSVRGMISDSAKLGNQRLRYRRSAMLSYFTVRVRESPRRRERRSATLTSRHHPMSLSRDSLTLPLSVVSIRLGLDEMTYLSAASGPRRLARPRTSPFHGGNTGSNPVGDANTDIAYTPARSVIG